MSRVFTHSGRHSERKDAIIDEIAREISRQRLTELDLKRLIPTLPRQIISELRNRRCERFSESRLLAIAETLGLHVTLKIERVAA